MLCIIIITSRDHKKVISHQVTFNDDRTLFLGFSPVVNEDGNTLLDVTIDVLWKLSFCYYSDLTHESS